MESNDILVVLVDCGASSCRQTRHYNNRIVWYRLHTAIYIPSFYSIPSPPVFDVITFYDCIA
jgi:hypothetical protein